MLLPNNSDRIQTISEVFRKDIERHEANGGTYYDEKAGQLAKEAIATCMPDLVKLQKERLIVEAARGITLQGDQVAHHEGLHVEASLARVSIQQLVSTIEDDELGSVALSNFDLFAVLVPHYIDPDPVDIVFGDELLVPFSEIEHFEPAKA